MYIKWIWKFSVLSKCFLSLKLCQMFGLRFFTNLVFYYRHSFFNYSNVNCFAFFDTVETNTLLSELGWLPLWSALNWFMPSSDDWSFFLSLSAVTFVYQFSYNWTNLVLNNYNYNLTNLLNYIIYQFIAVYKISVPQTSLGASGISFPIHDLSVVSSQPTGGSCSSGSSLTRPPLHGGALPASKHGDVSDRCG